MSEKEIGRRCEVLPLTRTEGGAEVVVVDAVVVVDVDVVVVDGGSCSLSAMDVTVVAEPGAPGAADVGAAKINTVGTPLSAAESTTPTATRV